MIKMFDPVIYPFKLWIATDRDAVKNGISLTYMTMK